MEGKKTQPRAILVFGAPCSGKTTFSKKFSKQFNTPYFDLTAIREKHDFNRETLLDVVALLATTHQNIILEGEMDTEADRAELRNLFRKAGYNPTVIWIQTDISTIKSRLKARLHSVAKAKEEYDTKVSALEPPAEHENPIVLSGKHTFETQIKQVLSQLV